MQQEWNLMFSQLPSNTRSGWLQGWQQVGDKKGYWWARRSGSSSTWYQSTRKGNQSPQGNNLTPPLQHCGWTVPMCCWGLAFPAHHYNPCVLTKRINTRLIQLVEGGIIALAAGTGHSPGHSLLRHSQKSFYRQWSMRLLTFTFRPMPRSLACYMWRIRVL